MCRCPVPPLAFFLHLNHTTLLPWFCLRHALPLVLLVGLRTDNELDAGGAKALAPSLAKMTQMQALNLECEWNVLALCVSQLRLCVAVSAMGVFCEAGMQLRACLHCSPTCLLRHHNHSRFSRPRSPRQRVVAMPALSAACAVGGVGAQPTSLTRKERRHSRHLWPSWRSYRR